MFGFASNFNTFQCLEIGEVLLLIFELLPKALPAIYKSLYNNNRENAKIISNIFLVILNCILNDNKLLYFKTVTSHIFFNLMSCTAYQTLKCRFSSKENILQSHRNTRIYLRLKLLARKDIIIH